jgi:general secretion pathway protein G
MDMKTRKQGGRRERTAFTLLEILLVVGLLALLAAFVVPSLTKQAENAKIDMARAAIGPNGPLSQSIDLFKTNTGQYPEELKYLCEKPGNDEVAEKWKGPYIKDPSGLIDPWGHEYKYENPGKHNEAFVDLWSMGPDGQDGTEDDVKNWKDDR